MSNQVFLSQITDTTQPPSANVAYFQSQSSFNMKEYFEQLQDFARAEQEAETNEYSFTELIRAAQNIVANKADAIRRSKSVWNEKGATEGDYLKIYRQLNKIFDDFTDLER